MRVPGARIIEEGKMCKLLVLYEYGPRADLADAAAAVMSGAEAAGAVVGLAPLGDATFADIVWADALALGIEARGSDLPREVKRWLDALGFSGWRGVLDGKPACVFAARLSASAEVDAACRITARVLGTRGMNAITAADLVAGGADRRTLGSILGARFAIRGAPALMA